MITAHAIVRPTSVLYNVFIIPSANGNVFISCFEQDTIGHKKLFHAPTNVKIDRAIIDDFTIGNTTLKKIRKRPQPSILAALIRSSGISRMACRIINTPNAVGNGKISALKVFNQPRFLIIKNNGIIITTGTISDEAKSILNKIEKPYNISIISSKDLAIPYTEYVLNPN